MLFAAYLLIMSAQNSFHVLPTRQDPFREEERAIEIILNLQHEKREDDVEIPGIQTSKNHIPVVHPQLLDVPFYDGGGLPIVEKYHSSHDNDINITTPTGVQYQDLLTEANRFIGLVGKPGAGKTTMSKRLAKTKGYVSFHMKFSEINHKEGEKMTLKELLLDHSYPELNQKTCDFAFSWIRRNQRRCLFVMDGLDQVDWPFGKHVARKSYDTPQHVWDLVANLWSGQYLPKSHVVVTSRPFAMLTLPPSIRPSKAYLLQDLSLEDMKSLFFALSGKMAEKLWETLNCKSPELVHLLLNPLLLQFYIEASLKGLHTAKELTTMTRIFASILENLRRSDHSHHSDINELTEKLSRIAYHATKNKTIVITADDFKRENLDVNDVQDLIVTYSGYKGSRLTCKIFEGDLKMYFPHQTLQEFYTALYIADEMSIDQFEGFVEEEIFKCFWTAVRRFLCGILFDIKKEEEDSFYCSKRQILLKGMQKRFQEESVKTDHGSLPHLCVEVHECRDEVVDNAIARFFPANIQIVSQTLTASECSGISHLLRIVPHRIDSIDLAGTFHHDDVGSQRLQRICLAITAMKSSIGVLSLRCHYLPRDDSTVQILLKCLVKVQEKVVMDRCFGDGSIDKKIENAFANMKTNRLNQSRN